MYPWPDAAAAMPTTGELRCPLTPPSYWASPSAKTLPYWSTSQAPLPVVSEAIPTILPPAGSCTAGRAGTEPKG